MSRWCVALAAVLAILLGACGSADRAVSDKQAAQAVVLEVSSLPPGSTVAKEAIVGEKCDPITYFKSYATATAAPFGFFLPKGELLQTVGVFKNSVQAHRAFAAVTSKSARDCVGAQMQKTVRLVSGSSGDLRAEAAPRPLPGETTKTMRLVLSSKLAGAEVERTAILHGRLLTTLTFIALNQPLSQDLRESVSHYAANLVDKAASSIES
jgi:hypothetical protein